MRVSRSCGGHGQHPGGEQQQEPNMETYLGTFGDMMVTLLSMVGLHPGRYLHRWVWND
jgi:hypothetical protein